MRREEFLVGAGWFLLGLGGVKRKRKIGSTYGSAIYGVSTYSGR